MSTPPDFDSSACSVAIDYGVVIPMSDGTRLKAALYQPRRALSASSAICALTPYTAHTHHAAAMLFAQDGYAVIIANTRGRGGSEGAFHPRDAARDAHDLVVWTGAQRWCDGRVAMWGGSYLGRCQWAAASRQPPALRAIAPVASPFYGVDVPLRNNIFPTFVVRWLSLLMGPSSNERLFADEPYWRSRFATAHMEGEPLEAFGADLADKAELFKEWLNHPRQDAYWDEHNPAADDYGRIDLPILTITGAYDGDQPGALEHYRRHLAAATPAARAKHFLIIGPWDHAGCSRPQPSFCGINIADAGVLDMRKLHLEWYDWTLRGRPRPTFLKDQLAYYIVGAERWRYAPTLEAVTAYHRRLHPCAADGAVGFLDERTRSAAPAQYRHDPLDVTDAELERQLDPEDLTEQRLINARAGKCLVYETAPFTEPLEVAGFFRFEAWIAIDQPDADFRVEIHAIDARGDAVLLTADWMRARYREGLREETLVATDQPQLYRFERFPFTARRLNKGDRLRLIIGPLHSIHSERNDNSGGLLPARDFTNARPVVVHLYHDSHCPSALHVPVGSGGSDAD